MEATTEIAASTTPQAASTEHEERQPEPAAHSSRDAPAPRSIWAAYVAMAIITVIGGGAAFWLSRDFRAHVSAITLHFSTGNWETRTEKVTVEAYVRSQYPSRSDWLISFVAGTGQSFGLQPDVQKQTISTLGWAVLADDGGQLTIRDTPLPAAYGRLLADSIESLGQDKSARQKTALSVLAQLMRYPAPNTRLEVSPETYRRATEVLDLLPDSDPLVRATQAYHLFEFDAGLRFPAFDVATQPAYDLLTWTRQAQTLSDVQSNRCVASISPIDNANPVVPAIASTYPRVLRLSIERPWLNAALLDAKRKDPLLAAEHFGPDGVLRIVPAYLWILMPQEVRLEFQDEDARRQAITWANARNCCRVVCGDTEITLEARSVFRRQEDGLLAGDISGSAPTLFAVVSRRRAGTAYDDATISRAH